MLYKNNKGSVAIVIAASVIALTLVTAASFNHYYPAFAASKKGSGGVTTLGSVSSSSPSPSSSSSSSSTSTGTPSPNTLTKKQLSSFISCVNTANKSGQGLTHKVVTNCLDIAKGTIAPIPTTSAASSRTSKGSLSLILPS